MSIEQDEEHPVRRVARLIDAWCGRRELKPLSVMLPGYLAFNGLTDGWGHLQEALDEVRIYYAGLPDAEVDELRAARADVYRVLKDR